MVLQIRNNSEKIRTYTINKDVIFTIYEHSIAKTSTSGLIPVSYETLKKAVNNHEQGILCWIYAENNKITKVEQEYIA